MSNNMRDEIIQVLLATSGESEGMTAEAIIAALTYHQAESEPVAFATEEGLKNLESKGSCWIGALKNAEPRKGVTVPLCRCSQPAAQVPEGWKLVPVKATKEMGRSLFPVATAEERQEMWDEVLSVAPSIAEKPQWIRFEERLPTEEDAFVEDIVWVCQIDKWGIPTAKLRGVLDVFPGDHITHWLPTGLRRPEPPEVMND